MGHLGFLTPKTQRILLTEFWLGSSRSLFLRQIILAELLFLLVSGEWLRGCGVGVVNEQVWKLVHVNQRIGGKQTNQTVKQSSAQNKGTGSSSQHSREISQELPPAPDRINGWTQDKTYTGRFSSITRNTYICTTVCSLRQAPNFSINYISLRGSRAISPNICKHSL